MTKQSAPNQIILQNYVVGFAFSADRSQIVLLRKNRPAWQTGKLNGLGGKTEPDETPLLAMCREFLEETDVVTQEQDWQHFATLKSLDGQVECFKLFDDKVLDAKTMESEEIVIMPVDMAAIKQSALPSCVWLIDIALDNDPHLMHVTAQYDQYFNPKNIQENSKAIS